ncbi:uncharacterized protein LOC130807051 [Amaranthus tricolor]|uniref:uncharacterized protein LOC130807051 n=1 Tax=Amaranthus tricolor TaxID=29722 RepID=UPI00258EE4AE|nr:uncharacterized protein LOC130807051 [Amaranthus tricolor]
MALNNRVGSVRGAQEKIKEEPPVALRNPPCTVTSVFLANIAGYWRNVSVLWCKNVMNTSFNIMVEGCEGNLERHQTTCKVELKPWHFWSKKGYKSFTIEDIHHQIDVYWDLRSAKYSNNSPEPCSDYYIALVSDEEVVLLLGDYNKKAYKRTKKRPALVEAIPTLKKEVVYSTKSFATRARFRQGKDQEYDIVVETTVTGLKDPEMWISIDGIVLIHVKNLQWKFRGNEMVVVNRIPIQVLWDVHGWLFSSAGNGYGLFIFKPEAPEVDTDKEGSNHRMLNSNSSSAGSLFYSSISTQSKMADFCLLLQAWKVD